MLDEDSSEASSNSSSSPMPWSSDARRTRASRPHGRLADDPAMARFAERINPMPKYVASRTLSEPPEWNATLIEGDVEQAIPA